MSLCLSMSSRCDQRSVSTNQKPAWFTGQEVAHSGFMEIKLSGAMTQQRKKSDRWHGPNSNTPLLLPPPTHRPSSHVVEEEAVRCRGDRCHPLPHARQSEHSEETFPASVIGPAHQPGHALRQGDRWGADVIITGVKKSQEQKVWQNLPVKLSECYLSIKTKNYQKITWRWSCNSSKFSSTVVLYVEVVVVVVVGSITVSSSSVRGISTHINGTDSLAIWHC